ncbi:MAG: hypothetical protein ACO21J_10365 [Anaerohalosphaeraceae bacterium]|jgi:hypothetical protein
MKFCEREIEMAQKLHALNLQWHPQAGNYVFDIKGIIEKSSPFQTGVYFILDIKHFLKRAGSPEAIKASMCWLPVWEDCRTLLKSLGVSWSQVENRLIEKSAFQNDSERVVLYEMILERLQ